MKILLAALAASTATLVSCGGSQTYSAEDVREAFSKKGYALYEPPQRPVGGAVDPWGSGRPIIMLPRGGEPFVVFIGTVTDAEEVWSRYESQQGDGSFDARRANVILISDSGLSTAHRQGVKAALAALPDRGSPVIVATSLDVLSQGLLVVRAGARTEDGQAYVAVSEQHYRW